MLDRPGHRKGTKIYKIKKSPAKQKPLTKTYQNFKDREKRQSESPKNSKKELQNAPSEIFKTKRKQQEKSLKYQTQARVEPRKPQLIESAQYSIQSSLNRKFKSPSNRELMVPGNLTARVSPTKTIDQPYFRSARLTVPDNDNQVISRTVQSILDDENKQKLPKLPLKLSQANEQQNQNKSTIDNTIKFPVVSFSPEPPPNSKLSPPNSKLTTGNLEVFDSDSSKGDSYRYHTGNRSEFQIPNHDSDISDQNEISLDDIEPNQSDTNDKIQDQQQQTENQQLVAKIQQDALFYDQLVDENISIENGLLQQSQSKFSEVIGQKAAENFLGIPQVKSDIQLLVMDQIDEEVQSEESDNGCRPVHQSAPIESTQNVLIEQQDQLVIQGNQTVQQQFRNIDVSPQFQNKIVSAQSELTHQKVSELKQKDNLKSQAEQQTTTPHVVNEPDQRQLAEDESKIQNLLDERVNINTVLTIKEDQKDQHIPPKNTVETDDPKLLNLTSQEQQRQFLDSHTPQEIIQKVDQMNMLIQEISTESLEIQLPAAQNVEHHHTEGPAEIQNESKKMESTVQNETAEIFALKQLEISQTQKQTKKLVQPKEIGEQPIFEQINKQISFNEKIQQQLQVTIKPSETTSKFVDQINDIEKRAENSQQEIKAAPIILQNQETFTNGSLKAIQINPDLVENTIVNLGDQNIEHGINKTQLQKQWQIESQIVNKSANSVQITQSEQIRKDQILVTEQKQQITELKVEIKQMADKKPEELTDQKKKFQNAMETLRQLKQAKLELEKNQTKTEAPLSKPQSESAQNDLTPKVTKSQTQEITSPKVKQEGKSLIDKLKTGVAKKLTKQPSANPTRANSRLDSQPKKIERQDSTVSSSKGKQSPLGDKLKQALKKKIGDDSQPKNKNKSQLNSDEQESKLTNKDVKATNISHVGPSKEELMQKINAAKQLTDQIKQDAQSINKIFKREANLKRLEDKLESKQVRDEDQNSELAPHHTTLDEDVDSNYSCGKKSELIVRNPKFKNLDSVTAGGQSQIRVDIAALVRRQPLLEDKKSSEQTSIHVSQMSISEKNFRIQNIPYENNDPEHLDLNDFCRSVEEQNDIKSRKYPLVKITTDKIHFATDCTQVFNCYRKFQNELQWNFEKHQTSNSIHLQWMQKESDLALETNTIEPSTAQNFYYQSTKYLKALNWDIKSVDELENVQKIEKIPILLNQILYIQGQTLKVYALKYRQFQIGDDLLLSLPELVTLKPEFKDIGNHDFSALYESIVYQFQFIKHRTEFNFQLIFLQFAFDQNIKPYLVRIDSKQKEKTFVKEEMMLSLIFKIDKRVRQILKMRPNFLIKAEPLFKQYWMRLSSRSDDETQIVRIKAGFQDEDDKTSCAKTVKPDKAISIGIDSESLSYKLIRGRDQDQQIKQKMSVTPIYKQQKVEIPNIKSLRNSPDVQVIPQVVTYLPQSYPVYQQQQFQQYNKQVSQHPMHNIPSYYVEKRDQKQDGFTQNSFVQKQDQTGNFDLEEKQYLAKGYKRDQWDTSLENKRRNYETFGSKTDEKVQEKVQGQSTQTFSVMYSTFEKPNQKPMAVEQSSQTQNVTIKDQGTSSMNHYHDISMNQDQTRVSIVVESQNQLDKIDVTVPLPVIPKMQERSDSKFEKQKTPIVQPNSKMSSDIKLDKIDYQTQPLSPKRSVESKLSQIEVTLVSPGQKLFIQQSSIDSKLDQNDISQLKSKHYLSNESKLDQTNNSMNRNMPFTTKRSQEDQVLGFFAIPNKLQTIGEERILSTGLRKLDHQKSELRKMNGIQTKRVVAEQQNMIFDTLQNQSAISNMSNYERYVDGEVFTHLNHTTDSKILSPRTNDRIDIWRRKRSEQPQQSNQSRILTLPEITTIEQLGQSDWFAKAMIKKNQQFAERRTSYQRSQF